MGDSTSSTSIPIIPTVQPWENFSSPYFLFNSDNPVYLLLFNISLKRIIVPRVGQFLLFGCQDQNRLY